MERSLDDAARNRLILRRTLSFIAWQYSLWNGLLGLLKAQFLPQAGWLMVAHAGALGLAGFGLWRPRAWGWAAAGLAVLGSIAWVVRELQNGNPQAALIDGVFPALALAAFLRTREPQLDKPGSQGENP